MHSPRHRQSFQKDEIYSNSDTSKSYEAKFYVQFSIISSYFCVVVGIVENFIKSKKQAVDTVILLGRHNFKQ